MSTPDVTVILPVRNAGRYLEEALRSILTQERVRFEVVVVDDGSTDRTPAILNDAARSNKQLRVLRQESLGVGAALNHAVRESQGRYIARMDADDVALPLRLATQLAWMQQQDLDVCGSWAQSFGERSKRLEYPQTDEELRCAFLFGCPMLHPTVMARGDVLRKARYPENCLSEDHALWTTLLPDHRFGNVPKVLLRYRRHPEQSIARERTLKRLLQQELCCCWFEAMAPSGLGERRGEFLRLWEGSTEPLDEGELRAAGEVLLELAAGRGSLGREVLAQQWDRVCRIAFLHRSGTWSDYWKMRKRLSDSHAPLMRMLRTYALRSVSRSMGGAG